MDALLSLRNCGRKLLHTFFYALLITPMAHASLIPVDLSVSSVTELDTVNSFGDVLGESIVFEAGSPNSTTYSGGVANGDDPLLGNHTDIGDGIGYFAEVEVQDDEFLFGLDSLLSIDNNSLVDTYEIFFKLTFLSSVYSSGDDAYADTEFTIEDSNGEIFFTDLTSDTVNGNLINGNAVQGFGGPLFDDGMFSFSYILNPMQSVDLDLFLTIEGGDFLSGQAAATFGQSLVVDSVSRITVPPQSVPEPPAILLLTLGLIAIFSKRKP